MLRLELGDLQEMGFDATIAGFTTEELDALLNITEVTDGLTDEDDVPEAPDEPTTRLGDVWILGKHRLMCGDSTSIDAVEKLMDGQKAEMVFTDPPYGMNAVTKSSVLKKNYGQDILGDDNTDAAKDSFLLAFGLYPDANHVWWGANYYGSALPDSECWIVWDKNNGQSDQTDCELAWTNFRSVVRQFTMASEKTNRVHPTQKPISLIEWVFDRFKVSSNFILDLFGGSGSTLIGCEKMGRKAFVMELDPKYCDVIIKRWEEYTGKNAVNSICGREFKTLQKQVHE
jgi:DNA modification methylase